MALKTPLYDEHIKCGAHMVDFAGYKLPIKYTSLEKEHKAVRSGVGIFDVSHMGEVYVSSTQATAFIQYLIANNIKSLSDYQILYTPMCNYDGGVIDDLLVYKYNSNKYLLVINASNIDKDYKWISSIAKSYDVELNNSSFNTSQIAIQGRKAQSVLQKLTKINLDDVKFFHFNPTVKIASKICMLSRTGYTGEDGFEIYCNNEDASHIWRTLLKFEDVVPCGLGARDTLRFEASLPLYGNELADDISALESGLSFFVKLDNDDFIGKEALVSQKENGLKRKIVGFEMSKGISRHGYEVYSGDELIGHVTTGYKSPTLGKSIGLALIDANYAGLNKEISIKVRNKIISATLIKKTFYKKNYSK